MMTDDPQTLERTNMLLVTLIAEVRGLRVDIASAGRRPPTTRPRSLPAGDVTMLTYILPAIVAAVGAENVTVHSLGEAAQDLTLEAKSLRRALDAAGMNALQLGKLFTRAAKFDTPIAGLFVHRIGNSREGVMIRVDANHRDHHIATSVAAALQGKIAS